SGYIANVVDGSNPWTRVASPGNYYGSFYYVANPTIDSANSYKVSVFFRNSGNQSSSALYCVVGRSGINTAVTAQNGTTLNGPVSTQWSMHTSGGVCAHISSLSTSTSGNLVFN